jgi:hypothetical protein
MRRRAVAGVATQGVSPVMAMLVALVIALILLLADPVKAQETTTEETTVLAADAADMKVEAETDNTSVKVDKDGEVSVSTDDGSSSDDGTSQQSSVTVQQNQTDEGSGSRASTGDVNIGASQNSSGCQNSRNVKTFSGTRNQLPTDSFRIDGDHFRLRYTTDRARSGTPVRVKVDVLDANSNSTGQGFTANNGNDATDNVPRGPGTFKLDITATNASYNITVQDCRGNDNNDGRNRRRHHHDRDRDRHRHRHHDRDRDRDRNRFFGRGAADQQYTRIVEERVIRETIPDKGRLAATGGVPLTGAAVLGLASVGLGVSILRFAIRRDP